MYCSLGARVFPLRLCLCFSSVFACSSYRLFNACWMQRRLMWNVLVRTESWHLQVIGMKQMLGTVDKETRDIFDEMGSARPLLSHWTAMLEKEDLGFGRSNTWRIGNCKVLPEQLNILLVTCNYHSGCGIAAQPPLFKLPLPPRLRIPPAPLPWIVPAMTCLPKWQWKGRRMSEFTNDGFCAFCWGSHFFLPGNRSHRKSLASTAPSCPLTKV